MGVFPVKKILFGIWIASAVIIFGACANAPILYGNETNPGSSACPTDGTVYEYGSCTLPDGVIPAAPSFNVQPGAPTKVCELNGVKWECPGSYVIPQNIINNN